MYYIIICIFNYWVFKHFTSCFLFLFLFFFILRKGEIGLRGSQQHISTYWHNYPLTVPIAEVGLATLKFWTPESNSQIEAESPTKG